MTKHFRLTAVPHVIDATCPKCRRELVTLSTMLSDDLYICCTCETAYELALKPVADSRLTDKAAMITEAKRLRNK